MYSILFVFITILIQYAYSYNLEDVKSGLNSIDRKIDFSLVVDQLIEEYEFDEKSLCKAYDVCESKNLSGDELLACYIASFFREVILQRHQLLLCFKEYFMETSINCTITCFQNYTPECLKCLGELLPRFLECMNDEPYEYPEL